MDKHERKLAGLSDRLSSCVFPEIRKWMIMNDATFTSMAKVCGISMSTMRNGLTGRTEMGKDVIDKLLETTGLSYEEAFRK